QGREEADGNMSHSLTPSSGRIASRGGTDCLASLANIFDTAESDVKVFLLTLPEECCSFDPNREISEKFESTPQIPGLLCVDGNRSLEFEREFPSRSWKRLTKAGKLKCEVRN